MGHGVDWKLLTSRCFCVYEFVQLLFLHLKSFSKKSVDHICVRVELSVCLLSDVYYFDCLERLCSVVSFGSLVLLSKICLSACLSVVWHLCRLNTNAPDYPY